jgi:hypothetical protein
MNGLVLRGVSCLECSITQLTFAGHDLSQHAQAVVAELISVKRIASR